MSVTQADTRSGEFQKVGDTLYRDSSNAIHYGVFRDRGKLKRGMITRSTRDFAPFAKLRRCCRCSVVGFVVLAGLCSSAVQAAQQTFWPVNEWPPPTWRFASTNDTPMVISVPGLGTIYARRFQLTNLFNPITPPALGSTTSYSYGNSLLNFELSLDNAAWVPGQASGPVTMSLQHTNDAGASRLFETRLLQMDMPGTTPFGTFLIRQSPTVASIGQTIITTTNGGYLISSFINAQWDMSIDGGNTWIPTVSVVYLELGGPPGDMPPTALISHLGTNTVQICWATHTNKQYQVQWLGTVDATHWTNLGSLVPGTGSNVCVSDSIAGWVQKFYKIQVLP
jgi:hypothetical protein